MVYNFPLSLLIFKVNFSLSADGLALVTVNTSVRKVVSRSKFTEQMFMPQAEQNFKLCAQTVFLFQFSKDGRNQAMPVDV